MLDKAAQEAKEAAAKAGQAAGDALEKVAEDAKEAAKKAGENAVDQAIEGAKEAVTGKGTEGAGAAE